MDIIPDWYIDEELSTELKDLYLAQIHMSILNKLDEVVSGMSYKNFIDEAKEHIEINKLDNTQENIILYAKLIYKEFSETYDKLVSVDFDDEAVYISESLMDFEYGTALKPALMVLTKAIQDCFEELED